MLNKAILMGRLTKDPVLTTTPAGLSIVRFTLAIDRRFQRQGEEKQTDFLNIVGFGRTADFVSRYFVKGQLAVVVGSIQTRSWEQDGQRRYATEIIADEVNFGGSKKDNPNSTGDSADSVPAAADDADSGFMPLDDDDSLPF